MTNKKMNMSFEQSMKRLEEIIESLESENVSLEDSVALYKEGMEISLKCDLELKKTEEEISIISERTDGSIHTKEISESELRE